MSLLDRYSAQRVADLMVEGLGGDEVKAALRSSLLRGLSPETAPNAPLGNTDAERLERFFDVIIQVEPLPPQPYTAQEIAQLARHSEREKIKDADEARDSQDPEDRDMEFFYRGIANDYAGIAEDAEANGVEAALKTFRGLDTKDRGDFGWGSGIWDEGRWYATTKDPFI